MKFLPILHRNEFLKKLCALNFNDSQGAYPPEYDDLYGLYTNVRLLGAVSILEIGSGWSTLALAMGLYENKMSFGSAYTRNVRHPNPFCLLSVDASAVFLALAHDRVPRAWLDDPGIKLMEQVAVPSMTTVSGKICHTFSSLPSFTADFVYLDGPDCQQVQGEVNGFSVDFGSNDQFISGQVFPNHHYGLPMSADLLLIEHFFWPGTSIVIDGRGANAAYLRTEFRRRWDYSYDSDLDQHWFHLDETSWGSVCTKHMEMKRQVKQSLSSM